ncbi:electron transport complex subunit RsxE [Candidatus Poribacteria bacterium]|nr:electron transport complex subunit RsxE [Candidatus Poribacteria bacterium]
MVLGICSTLAVTNRVANGIAMSLAVLFVTVFSSVTVSLIRKIIPHRIRMAVYTVIIATYVVIADRYLKAYWPDLSQQMGPYVALIITNCIIMGRAESYASNNNTWLSFLDALGVGFGYAFSLLVISVVREILGFGTLMGYHVMGQNWTPWLVMAMPPGAFIVLGTYIWILRSITKHPSGENL